MARRIGVIGGIAIDIREPIPGSRIHRTRHNRVGLDEAAGQGVVEASAIVVEAGVGVEALAGEEPVGQGFEFGIDADDLAVGIELGPAHFAPGVVGDQCGASLNFAGGSSLPLRERRPDGLGMTTLERPSLFECGGFSLAPPSYRLVLGSKRWPVKAVG